MTTERSSSIERMLAIPRLFTEERPIWSVEEVANELRLSISTAYRYFQSLIKFEYLDEIPNRGYCLGPAFIEFDRIIRVTDPLSHAAGPIISSLAPAMPLGTSLILCQVYQKKVMCIHHETVGPAGEGISYQRGKPMPFYRGATSKVILAHMPWRQQKREYESHTQELQQAGLGNDWKSFSLGLRNIRKRGYCVSRGEVDLGRMGIAAPIFSGNGHVSHSLSAVAWQDQIDQASEDRLVTSIVMAAARISEAMARANGSPEAAASRQKP